MVDRLVLGLQQDPALILSNITEKGRSIVDLIRSHPWASLGVAASGALIWNYVKAPRNLPPGPRGLPYVGALSCYAEDLPQKMLAWRAQYGDVISFYRLGKLNVILNSEKTIRDAFAKQGDDFGHRVEEDHMKEFGLCDEIFARPFNERWKKNKKFALTVSKVHGFGNSKSEVHTQDQIEILDDFLLKQKDSAVDISKELRLLCASVISAITLGTTETWQSPLAAQIVNVTKHFDESLIPAFVAFNWWWDYLPLRFALMLVRKLRDDVKKSAVDITDFLKTKINPAAADISEREADTMVDAYLKDRGTSDASVHQIAHNVFAFLPDAVHGTSTVILWCLLHMTLKPEIQTQIHREIQESCGSRRVSLADKEKLKTIQALLIETLRIMNAFPFSMQRVLSNDIHFHGYDLPKGTIVSANNYGVHFDPDIFPNPDEFQPNRFINEDGSLNNTLANRVFGFSLGPRKCLGEYFARQLIFLVLARLVQRFEMDLDPNSAKPTLDKIYESTFPRPQNFKLVFKPKCL